MRIPKFLKNIIKFCDTEASRYALCGVKCEHKDGVSVYTATDGRALTSVSFVDTEHEGDAVDAVVDGKPLAKAFTAAGRSRGSKLPTLLEFEKGMAQVCGDGQATATTHEGRFPRYGDVMPADSAGHVVTRLDASLLKAIAELYASLDMPKPFVDVYVHESKREAVLFAATTDHGEVVRTVLMPMACDGQTLPPFPPAASAEVAEEDNTPAPPPELVDDEVLAASLSDADVDECDDIADDTPDAVNGHDFHEDDDEDEDEDDEYEDEDEDEDEDDGMYAGLNLDAADFVLPPVS